MTHKLIFFGNEQLASGITTKAPILHALIDAGYTIPAVVINQKLSRNLPELAVANVAAEHNIPVIDIATLEAQIQQFEPEVAVLAAFGKIIPQRTLNLFPKGIINIHPSLLPKYRGSTPIESAILNGDAETGVSIMKLVAEMDAGPIFNQSRLSLSGTETKQELYNSLSTLGAQSLVKILPQILEENLQPTDQDTANEQISISKTISKSDGIIDWQKPAEKIEKEVRAYLGWPGSRTTILDRDVTVTEVLVMNESGKPGKVKPGKALFVYCGTGALHITKLKPAGKREMTSKEFLAGIR